MLDLVSVLNEYKGKEIILLGHDNPDCDSIISAVLMSKLLNFKEIPNKIVIPYTLEGEEIIQECTRKSLSYFNNNEDFKNLDKYKGKLKKDDVIFLLDHNKTNHSGNIIGCLDHHPTTDDFYYDFYVNKPSSSTGKLVFDLMVEYNYPITKEIVELVCFSVFVDTCSLKSTKCTDEDKLWIKESIEKLNLDYDKLYEEGLCLTDLSKSIYTISQNGLKKYNYDNINVWSSYIQINNNCDENIINTLIGFINYCLYFEDVELWVFLIVDFARNKTREYRITGDKVEEIIHTGIVSRGTTIMPNIEKNIKGIISYKYI